METIIYRNRLIRYLAALAGSLIILFNGRPFDLVGALSAPLFYPAFILSTLVALFLVYCVHKVTLSLDFEYPWNDDFAVRLSYQICLGIMAPAFVDLVVFYIYFEVLGKDILTNGFLINDFPLVIILLTVWNTYYWLHYTVSYQIYKAGRKQ